MKVGVWFQPTTDAHTVARRVVDAEQHGFDFVGITDGQMIWRDVYACLALAAARTERVRLGPWVTNPVTRHITATANSICTLDELSGGRAFVGIGVGDDSVHTIGRQPATIDSLASDVDVLGRLMSGEAVEHGDHTWRLATGHEPRPPIYWAAAGPRSLRTAAQATDGVVHSGWLDPDLMREAHASMDEGESERPPGSTSVARIFNTAVAISHDREEALNWAAPYAARAFIYPASSRVPGWDEEKRQALIKEYDYYGHFGAAQTAKVPRELISRKAVVGTPEEATALLSSVAEAGYTHAALIVMGDVDNVMRHLAESVLPHLA